MYECRVYSDPPWSVVVTHEREHPERLYQVTVRCTQPQCGGSFKWMANTYGHAAYPNGAMTLVKGNSGQIASFRVCDCTIRSFELHNGKCPPWLTREEQVAWHLTT